MYVELIFCPTSTILIRKKIPYVEGLTIADVIAQSGIEQDYPEVATYATGIFSIAMAKTTSVTSSDRVEIYRPLTLDPKEKRRQRVKA